MSMCWADIHYPHQHPLQAVRGSRNNPHRASSVGQDRGREAPSGSSCRTGGTGGQVGHTWNPTGVLAAAPPKLPGEDQGRAVWGPPAFGCSVSCSRWLCLHGHQGIQGPSCLKRQREQEERVSAPATFRVASSALGLCTASSGLRLATGAFVHVVFWWGGRDQSNVFIFNLISSLKLHRKACPCFRSKIKNKL